MTGRAPGSSATPGAGTPDAAPTAGTPGEGTPDAAPTAGAPGAAASSRGNPGGEASNQRPEPVIVDARGTRCPMPVIMAARAGAGLPQGSLLLVLATDPAAAADLPAWCRMRGHTLLEADGGDQVRALIRLGS